MLALFQRWDVLALPSAQVWPFPVGERWPLEIAGRTMDTYHRWMEVTTYATFAGLPAISLPAGFDASGRWPMGLQLIAGPRRDAQLLEVAGGVEAIAGPAWARRPPMPASVR
jgi:amidase